MAMPYFARISCRCSAYAVCLAGHHVQVLALVTKSCIQVSRDVRSVAYLEISIRDARKSSFVGLSGNVLILCR